MTDDPTPSDVARWHETLGKNHRREVVWVKAISQALAKELCPILKRLEALEARLTVDRGVWREGTAYHKGNVVSHGGAAWIAQTDVTGFRPGGADGTWRLLSKKDIA
jgi:hypothetical protein